MKEINHAALLDKITFGGIYIVDIKDIDMLINSEVIEKSTTKVNYVTAEGQIFSRLMIDHDGVIDKMIAGAKVMGGKKINYCTLELTVKGKIANLNCCTVEQYTEKLYQIQRHLEEEYGIIVDFSCLTIKEMEINKTFKLQEDFCKYHRVINLIMQNLPYYLCSQMDYKKVKDEGSEHETYYATSAKSRKSKRYLLFKIYNKTKALENLIVLTDSYMRVEIKLVGAEKIKSALDTNLFFELTDATINQYFDQQMNKLIIEPTNKWKQSRDKQVLRLMKDERKRDIRHWQTNVLRILQNEEIIRKRAVVLDIEEITSLVDSLDLKANRKSDIKKNFRNQAKKYETAFCNQDNVKLDEIINKL